MGFLSRNTATLVSNSWRSARNQQTTCVWCDLDITHAAVIGLTTHCPPPTTMNLNSCSKITDAAVIALATHCPSLASSRPLAVIGLHMCDSTTDQANLAVLRDLGPS